MADSSHRAVLRRLPLYLGIAGGLGGVLPDLDHAYRILVAPGYTSGYLHELGWVAVLVLGGGSLVALNRRQVAALVLKARHALRWPAGCLGRVLPFLASLFPEKKPSG